ncbi:MAG: hypothetical protein SGI98_00825 [Verrucomicrobiota bacterium]|nr:hypothetical protein [Verrucomicrobiota bacterium]
MQRFRKFPGISQNANNGLFGGKMIKVNGTWGCLLLFFLWPLIILVLLGVGLVLLISSFFRRPRNLYSSRQSRPTQGQGDVIDVEVIRVDDEMPSAKTITIEMPENDDTRK